MTVSCLITAVRGVVALVLDCSLCSPQGPSITFIAVREQMWRCEIPGRPCLFIAVRGD